MNAPHACAPAGLLERYANQVEGTPGFLDRVGITETLVEVTHAAAVNARLAHEGMLCFDIKQFADPLRRKICERATSGKCLHFLLKIREHLIIPTLATPA
ncbi:MAG: hypothetical protein KA004_17545 [Verrucomicrobiales bacterium]|nr:hypothetical protein [Verrucomicrobiales bacterium]